LATNAHQRPRSQIHDQSSFLANLRPRSNTHAGHDNRNVNVHRNLFPNYPRSHDKTNYNINIDQEHTFTANFRPRSHSSSNGQDKNMQDTSFSRLWPRKNKNATNNSNSNCHTTSSHSHSQTNSQESTASSNFRPRSQETSGGNININMNSNSQESSSSNLNLRHRSQASSQDKSSSRLSLRRSQANSQERSTSRLSLRPRSQVNSQQSQESADRPRSPTNIPFLSNFRARPRSSVLEDQLPKSYSHPENPLKPREATEMPVGCGVGAALPRRRSRRTMRRSGKPHTKTNDGHEKGNENSTDPRAHRRAMRRSGKINANEVKENGNETSAGSRAHRRSMRRSGKINISTDDNDNCGENDNDGQDDENITRNASTDSSHIHRAHLARLQTNASTVLKRAIKRVYVEKTILSSLKELDTLIHYAERDLRTIPVVSRRILAIKSANNNNIVVEKQLQAASYLYSLRKKPENEAVKTARIVMNAASGMLDNNDGTSEQVEKFSKMERSLCETANNLGEISNKSCSVREQVLELLVLMTRRRAEIEIKAAICTSTSNIQQHHRGGKCHLESDESFTSEEEESYKSTEEEDLDEKENGSPKNVMKMTITIDADKKRGFTACEPAESLERGNEIGDDNKKKEAAAALIARVWKMKKLGGSKALAYLTRLRDIERDMANCASLTIYDKLTSEARGLAQAIRHDVEIIDPALRSVATTNTINSEEWDRTVTIGRRNAAISTVIRGVRQWRTTRSSEECTKERLRTIETMVESATLSNTEVAYKNTLDKLQHMMSELETTINTNTNIEANQRIARDREDGGTGEDIQGGGGKQGGGLHELVDGGRKTEGATSCAAGHPAQDTAGVDDEQ